MFNRIWKTRRLYFLLSKWEKESLTWSILFSSMCLKVNRNKSWGFITSTKLQSGSGYIIFKCSTLWSCDHKLIEDFRKFYCIFSVLRWRGYFDWTLLLHFKHYFAFSFFLFFAADRGVYPGGKKSEKNEITLEISFKAASILERPLQSRDRIYLFSSSPFFSHFTLSLSVTS